MYQNYCSRRLTNLFIFCLSRKRPRTKKRTTKRRKTSTTGKGTKSKPGRKKSKKRKVSKKRLRKKERREKRRQERKSQRENRERDGNSLTLFGRANDLDFYGDEELFVLPSMLFITQYSGKAETLKSNVTIF